MHLLGWTPKFRIATFGTKKLEPFLYHMVWWIFWYPEPCKCDSQVRQRYRLYDSKCCTSLLCISAWPIGPDFWKRTQLIKLLLNCHHNLHSHSSSYYYFHYVKTFESRALGERIPLRRQIRSSSGVQNSIPDPDSESGWLPKFRWDFTVQRLIYGKVFTKIQSVVFMLSC